MWWLVILLFPVVFNAGAVFTMVKIRWLVRRLGLDFEKDYIIAPAIFLALMGGMHSSYLLCCALGLG